MTKRNLVGKIFGIALVFVMIASMLGGLAGIVNSAEPANGEESVSPSSEWANVSDAGEPLPVDADKGVEGSLQVSEPVPEDCPHGTNGGSACGNCSRAEQKTNIGMRNPAAVYCEEMGCEYKVVKTEDGERGVCVLPDGSECDAWAFYRGECGEGFSYCAKKGWAVAAKAEGDSFATNCTTCVMPDGVHKTVSDLLDLSAKCTVGTSMSGNASFNEPDTKAEEINVAETDLPEYFDWRDKDGGDWMTPVKDQGFCGSCWAFSAVGAVEPQYNIFYDQPNLDLNLSEQYLVSSCSACGDCGGGWHSCALSFVRDEGITDEDCFPYTATDCSCSDRCDNWSSRLKTIDETEYVPSNTQTIKKYLTEKGPLSAAMGIGGDFGGHFDGDIYRCTDDSGANHAVVIAGYNETGDYWIVKNSWGSGWQDEGYFKVGCEECAIERNVYYAALYAWPLLLSPANGLTIRPGETNFTWKEKNNATGYHIQIDQVDTFDSAVLVEADPTEPQYTANLSTGSYYWRVKAHLDVEDSPYSPIWRLTVVDKPVVQVTTDPDSDYRPAITQTDDGKVWVVWQSYRSGGNGIWCKTSPDGGATWSEAFPIDSGIWGYDPAITQTNDGKIWVTFHSYESGNGDIWYTTSSDGGATWSDASQVTTNPDSDYDPAITQTADGKVWVVWRSYRSGNSDIWYKTSADGGETWSADYQLTTDPNWDELPTITQTDDGKVWVVWTSYRSGGNGIWCKTSSDGGETWSGDSPIDLGGIWGYDPAITQTNDGKIWVTFYSYESGNGDIWYTTSSDGGATWSQASRFTRFSGWDECPAATALSSGKLAVAWQSDRAVNYDIWYGVIGSIGDINPPPHLDWAENEPVGPEAGETVTVQARASDELGVQDVQLVWWEDGVSQSNRTMYDDGNHNDWGAGDGVYGVQIGPFPLIGTVVEYQIQITDIDGNVIVAPQYRYSFEVIKPFVKTADILLVSDYPYSNSIIPYYSDALDNLGYAYDVWDAELRGNIDGGTLNQYVDGVVIWSTPSWGYIGYSETQDNLTSYLDNGGKLFISGQDIGYYIGWSDFYRDYLHAQYVQGDINLYGLFGVTGDPVTDGLYVSISGGYGANNQARPSEINPISPAVSIFTYDPAATTALVEPSVPEEEMIRPESEEMLLQREPMAGPGETMIPRGSSVERSIGTKSIESSGSGALRVDTGTYKVVYFAFGFEAINSAADRATVMGNVLDWLAPIVTYNLTISSTSGGSVTTPGEGTFTYNASEVVPLVATADSGYHFVNWTGDVGTIGNVNSATTHITMNGNYSIVANFAQVTWVYNCTYENPEGTPKYGSSELSVAVVAEVPAGTVEGVNEDSYQLSEVFVPQAMRDSTAAGMTLVLHVGTADIWQSQANLQYLKQCSSIKELPGLPACITWAYTTSASWPLTVGDTWDFTKHTVVGGGMIDETVDRQGRVLEIVDVTVPAGTFSCYHIVEYDPASPDTYTYEHWFNATVKADVKVIDRDTWNGAETKVLTTFAVQYNLTINSTAGGNVTTPGEGIFGPYSPGEVVNLVAGAEPNYHFTNWTGDIDTIVDVNSRRTTITMNGDYSITANFAAGAAEVSAKWSKVATPYTDDWTVAPGSDIVVGASIPGGSVIYVVGWGWDDNEITGNSSDYNARLWKSDDSGVTWDDLADKVWDADSLPLGFNSTTSYFNYVACAPDNPDFMAVSIATKNALNNDFCNVSQAVVISDDGGHNFYWIRDISDSAANSTLKCVFDMAISDEDNDGKRNIALGGVGIRNGTCPRGLVYRYVTGGLVGGGWEDASAYDCWDNINDGDGTNDITSTAVTKVAFAPSWLTDKTVLAVSHTNTSTYLQSGVWALEKLWNAAAGFEPAVQVVANPSIWYLVQGAAAGLALPTDYEGRHAATRYAWVYVDNVTTYTATIYKVQDGAVNAVLQQITGKPLLASLSYLGSIDSGKAIAGLISAGTMASLATGTDCCEGVQVYRNDGITDMDICCQHWQSACKPPTGTMLAMVGYVLPSKAYALVSGHAANPFGWDESAFSFSLDDGDIWNQVGLVDTYVDYLSDVVKSADCSKTWVVSVNTAEDGVCGCDSVWLKADPLPEASEYSGAWIREWCGELTPNATLNSAQTPEMGLLRLAPEETDEALTVYLVDRGTATVYYDSTEGLGCWEKGSSTVDNITDLAVQDEATIYALGFNADVAVSDDHGSSASWSNTMDSKADKGHTIAVLGEGNVLVGGADGKVSYSDSDLATFLDGEASFTKLKDGLGKGRVHVAFDSYFDTNSVVYAAVSNVVVDNMSYETPVNAVDNGIYRWVIGESSEWKDLGCAGAATPTETQLGLGPSCDTVEVGYYGIVLSNAEGNPETDATTGGVLYATFYDAEGNVTGVARCLNPAQKVPCWEGMWDYFIQDTADNHGQFTLEPSSLKICGCLTPDTNGKLFAIDDNPYCNHFAFGDLEDSSVGRLWMYEDCYAKAGPVLESPADGAGVSCDPHYWWNDAFALEWDRQCDASSYNIQIAYDEDFTEMVLDISSKNSDCTEYDYEPISGSNPSYVVAEGALGIGSCGTTFYWRVRTADAETGEIVHSPWSEVRSFTVAGEAAHYNLTISSTSGGSVTTPGEGTFTYNASEVVPLVATADSGYQFVNWTGDVGTIGNVNSATTNITMNGNYSIIANFAEAQGWGFEIQPDVTKVGFNQDFTVNAVVTHYTGNSDTWQMMLRFDPALLEVTSVVQPTTLPNGQSPDLYPSEPSWNNTEGWVYDGYGIPPMIPYVNETFVFSTIHFHSRGVNGTSPLNFTYKNPYYSTQVILVGSDYLNWAHVVNGTVEVVPGATLQGNVTFSGRGTPPNNKWIENFTVRFYQNDTEISWSPLDTTTNDNGVFTIGGLAPGTYDIGIKNWTCLSELNTSITLNANETTVVNFGMTREGDSNNDDIITGADRSLLYSGWGKSQGEAGYDIHYDFNRDGSLGGADRSLMYANWAQHGDLV